MGSRGGREDSPRVRQIPIQFENNQEIRQPSRFQRQPQQQNNPLYNTMPSNYRPTRQYMEACDPYEQVNKLISQDRGSPDSRTNININHKPTPPVRQDQQHQHLGQHQQYQQQQDGTRCSSMNRDGASNDRVHDHQQRQRPHSHVGNHQQHAVQENSRCQSQQSETFNTQQGNQNLGDTESENSKAATTERELPIPMPPPPGQPDIEMMPEESGENGISSSTETDKQQQGNINEQQQQQQHQSSKQSQAESKVDNGTSPIQVQLDNVRQEVAIHLQQIIQFSGKDAKSKDARYLEEMLSRCELALDKIQCGSSTELRQQRKAIITLIEKGIDILERKIKLNADIQELTQGMDNQLAKQLHQQELVDSQN